jgi:hypothetical protein
MMGGPGMPGMPGPMPGGMPMHQPMFAHEPVPLQGPQFCPAPQGPGVPPSAFSLPNDGSPNAFSEDDRTNREQHGCFFYAGGMALMRERLGKAPLAYRSTGGVPGIDTGTVGITRAPRLLDFNDVRPDFAYGVRATAGYREGNCAFELSGFYVPQREFFRVVAAPGSLDLPFGAFNAPLGFQGDNGLWLQSDLVRLSVETTMASGEGNFRFGPGPGFEWILGVRYLDLAERLTVFTDDDGILAQPANPALMASYSVRAHNRILGGQFGFEFAHPLVSRVALSGSVKGAWGVNFLDVNHLLQRGDGFVGFNNERRETLFSHLYEAGLFADVLLTDQLRIRGGYQVLWLVNVPETRSQVDFNLANPMGHRDNAGSIFYHGPMFELQFAF